MKKSRAYFNQPVRMVDNWIGRVQHGLHKAQNSPSFDNHYHTIKDIEMDGSNNVLTIHFLALDIMTLIDMQLTIGPSYPNN